MNSHRLKQLKLHLRQLQNSIAANNNNNNNVNERLLVADVLEINNFGIKIKLSKPLKAGFDGKVKFQLTLPESGSIFTVYGILNSRQPSVHHSVSREHKISIDEAVYDCLKLSETTVLIKVFSV